MIDPSLVKNIVFDLGGVLLEINHQRAYDTMSEVLNRPFVPDALQPDAQKLLIDYEIGAISTEVFIWNIQRMASGKVPSGNEVAQAWNAMLIDWYPGIFELLDILKEQYTVFLLSNTNELHLQWVRSSLRQNHQINDWDTRFFKQTFYSHLIQMRKPDLSIYRHVAESAGIMPESTLFIDDTAVNVDGAMQAGWMAYLYDPENDLPTVVKDVLGLI